MQISWEDLKNWDIIPRTKSSLGPYFGGNGDLAF